MRSIHILILALGSWLAVSCAGMKFGREAEKSAAVPTEARPEDVAKADEFYRQGGKGGFHPPADQKLDLSPANTGFVVELDQQRAYLYRGADLVAVSKISSGRRHYRTETGKFVIGQKDLNHRSNLYGHYVSTGSGSVMVNDVTASFDPLPPGGQFQGSLMKYFQRFDLPNRRSTAMGFHAGSLPGYPASHGCIRLPATMAKWFYTHVPKGTPIVIRGSKYGVPYGTKQARPKRQPKVHPSLNAAPAPATPPAGAEGAEIPGDPAAPGAPAPDGTVPAPAEPAPPPAVPEPAAPTPPAAAPDANSPPGQ